MTKQKGGAYIAEALVREGIPYIFGVCGHGTVGLIDHLYDVRDDIKMVSPRHEQTAVHMADGYFRVAHRAAATLTSTGPGSANQIMGLAVAQTDSSAILSITANVPTQQFNRGPFQELNLHNQADFNNVIKPVVKRSFQPTRAEMLPVQIRQACATMTTGRPGPVNLDIPYNLFQEEADLSAEVIGSAFGERRSGASPDDVTDVVDRLLAARRPVLFVGHGMTLSEGEKELTRLARWLNIPVISSPNGMGTIDMQDPLSLGFIGRNGAYQANQAGRHADLVIAIGVRFDDRSASSWKPGYSWNFPETALVHVDLDHAELTRNYTPDIAILADARTFLRQVLAELSERGIDESPRLEDWQADIAGWRQEWEAFLAPNWGQHTAPIAPYRIVEDCLKVLPANAILSLDSGVHHNWYMQFWKARGPRSMLNTWGYSGMGFGPSSILGAKLAAPDRPCISICGDGGFTMVPHVLCTAVEYNIPVVWVVWNNFVWGAIRDLQYGYFEGREYGTGFYRGDNAEPYNPDFAAWARAAGVEGHTVTKSEDFAGVLEAAIASGKPSLIDVHVDGNIRPPATGTWELPPLTPKEPVFGNAWRP
ncbi:thiamine pyrophosphate-binding protein [Pseudohoeflea coraliihabitans]|uniref:Thiamine pyrophosphate-binding protein n=1 Tax=Pseudohoeflea coraliihabitans TaxID=2860393 RepID=A0ABS6WMQ4_9HYPH|nr:thiamine pyrophosphate-binding protein [Pseudohoeflea sp. DP4N28-3]MBW3097231.1 thiamine pyrophosphate-binding protein [Pseudohoeflea sp. DP4N28-3]